MLKKSYRWLRRAFQQGDELAYSKVYERYSGPVMAFVSQRVRDPEVARELVQEIFLKAHRFRSSYDPAHAITTWLWTIARNTVTDSLRKPLPDFVEREPDEIRSPEPDVETVLEEHGDRQALNEAIDKLTPLQRTVMMMRMVEQRSYAEIAQQLEISVSAVKCVVYRAKKFVLETSGCLNWGDHAGGSILPC